jgi:hypothetical protein
MSALNKRNSFLIGTTMRMAKIFLKLGKSYLIPKMYLLTLLKLPDLKGYTKEPIYEKNELSDFNKKLVKVLNFKTGKQLIDNI